MPTVSQYAPWTDTVQAGSILAVSVSVGPGAIVQRLMGSDVLESIAVAGARSFGPYLHDMTFRVSAMLGATVWASERRETGSVAPMVAMLSGSNSLAANVANFNAQVRDMDAGQTMVLPSGEFLLDIKLNELAKSIRIIGAGRPYYSGSTLVGGTIIRGEVNIQDQRNAEISDLGINAVGLAAASYPNGITGGSTTLNDTTSPMNQMARRVMMLGRGFASGGNQQHGFLFQNGRGFTVEDCVVYNTLNAYISRASGALFRFSKSFNAEASAVLFKSATSGGANDALDNTALCMEGYATADGFSANFTSQAEDGSKITRNSKFIGCTADASGTTTGQAVFRVDSVSTIAANRGTTFAACASKGDRAGNAFLVGDNFSEGVAFVACNAEDFGGLSFRSNATGATNLPSVIGGTAWRSGFADIINVSGLWAVCEVNGKTFDQGQTRTVANLPNAAISATQRFIVTDANATTFMSIVAGGGSNIVPVFTDGTNWRIG